MGGGTTGTAVPDGAASEAPGGSAGWRGAGGRWGVWVGRAILWAVLIVTAFAWSYVRYRSLPQVSGILYGVKPVIIAGALQALWGLGRICFEMVGGAGLEPATPCL